MRPRLLPPALALLACAAAPASAPGQARAPDAAGPPARFPGGAAYAVDAGKAPERRRPPLRVSAFSVSPARIVAGGSTVVRVHLEGGARRARVRVALVPATRRRPAATLKLGWRRTGVTIVRRWRPRALSPGDYVARVHAVDARGRTLKRTATASGKLPVAVSVAAPPRPPAVDEGGTGAFPIRGPWSFGGDDSRFGAQRGDHVHQGQDISAPEGTALVSPVDGVVFWRAVQPAGAGHYLVIRGTDGRDYVFMHLVAGSETVAKGDRVRRGQVIGQVGSTGDSRGSHLHFEIWPDGWFAEGSNPIDPRPDLERWATGG